MTKNISWQWAALLLIFSLSPSSAKGQSDECWSGTWSGTYSFQTQDSCALTDTGNIMLTLSVSNGVVTGSGTEAGIICYDASTCNVTGSGTFSGPLSGTVSGNSITLTGNWVNSCNGQTYTVQIGGTLSGCVVITGYPNLTVLKQGSGLVGMVRKVDPEGRVIGPLAGATVTVPELGSGTTDTNGFFYFTNAAPGTYVVTVTNTGYYSYSNSVTIVSGQTVLQSFDLLQNNGAGPPSQFNFASPQGKYFIPAMPGNLTFSVIVAWNGPPGSAAFNVSGISNAATLTDLGNGTALATLTIPAPSTITFSSQLSLTVTNGNGLSRTFNLPSYFEQLPGIVSNWFTWLNNPLLWNALSNTTVGYSKSGSWQLFTNAVPDVWEIGCSMGAGYGYDFTPLQGTLEGSVSGSGTGSLEVNVSKVQIFEEGGVTATGSLKVAYSATNLPTITPGWSVTLGIKEGVRAPAVNFIPVAFQPAAPAVTLAQNTWGLKSVVNAIKLGASLTQAGKVSGVYSNLGTGNCLFGTTSLNNSVSLGLELEAGAELAGAKLKFYGGGNATLDFNVCPQFNLNTVTIQGYVGASASIWFFSFDQRYTDQISFSPAHTIMGSSGAPGEPLSGWQPIGLQVKPWGAADQLPAATPRPRIGGAGSTDNLVLSNVLDIANPSVVATSSNTMILFTAYDAQKPWYAATDIGALTQTNGGAWSLNLVTDDPTADLNPKVANMGSNMLLAGWERITGDVSGATNPVQIGPNLEVVASWYNQATGVWSTPQQLTTNSMADRDPLPVAFGSTQGILWIENQAGDVPGDVTNGDSLLFSQWTGSTWSAPQTLWSAQKGILSYSFVADGSGEGHVVFCVDEDGMLDSVTNQELYGVATYKGAWQPAIQLTSDQLGDSLPTLVAPGGAPMCVWYRDSNVVYTPLSAWSPANVFVLTNAANDTPTLAGVTTSSGAAIAYSVLTPDGQDIYASFYNAAQGNWSSPRPLTADQDQDVQSSLGLAYDGTNLVVAYEQTQTLVTNVTLDVNGQNVTLTNVPEPGRTDLYVLSHAPGSDAGLVPGSLSADPPNPAPGSNATLSAMVENFGDFPLQNVPVVFYDGNPQQGGTQIGGTQMTSGSLIGGATQQVSVTWTVPGGTNSHNIFAVVDPGMTLPDRDRSNNTNSQMTVLPQLAVASCWNTEEGATTVALAAQIQNQGVIPAGPFNVSWRLGATNGQEIGNNSIAWLAPGQSVPVTYLWNTSGQQFSTPYVPVYVIADSSNVVEQFSTTNEVEMMMVPVVASWVPQITSIAVLESGEVQLSFTAANSSPSDFTLQSAGTLAPPVSWQTESGAVITATAPGAFDVQVAPQSGARFYRLQTSP